MHPKKKKKKERQGRIQDFQIEGMPKILQCAGSAPDILNAKSLTLRRGGVL